MTIPETYNLWLKLDVNKLQIDAIMSVKAVIIDTITDVQLLEQGIDGMGRKLQPYRNKDYAKFKKSLNSRGVTDLKVTGEFHSNFVMEAVNSGGLIYSKDSKAPKLERQYGEAIYDLTKENTAEIAQENILPVFLKDIKKSVQL